MKKYNQDYWKKELNEAKSERKDWLETAAKIYKLYLPKRTDSNMSRAQKKVKFNIFNSNVGVLESALFSRIPKPMVSRKFADPGDPISRVASTILERVLISELTSNSNFKSALKKTVKDYLVVGLGVSYVRYDADVSAPIMLSDDTEDLMAETSSIIKSQNTDIEHVLYKDFFHSDDDTWEKLRWAARRVYLSEEEVAKRFGKDIAKNISYVDDDDEDFSAEEEKDKTAEIFEVWCKESKKVYFINIGSDSILDEKDDLLGLPDFFPFAEPLIANANTEDSLEPVSDFELLESQYKQLDTLNNRINRLTSACRLAGIYSSENSEVKALLEGSGDSIMIPMRNYQAFASNGGLNSAVSWLDITQIANVLAQLSARKDEVQRQIETLSGISDVLRGGGANPYESAAATNAKLQGAGVRLSSKQIAVAEHVSELIKMRAHLICKFYAPEQILEKIGTIPQEDYQYVMPALQMLKDEMMVHFQITVSTDSLMAPEFQQIAAERNQVIQSLAQLLPQAIQGAQAFPEMGPALLHMLKWTISGMKGASEIEGVIDTHLSNLQAQQAAAAGQPKQEKPDVAMMQVQLQQQQAQQNAEIKAQELQLAAQKQQMEFELNQQKLQIESQKLQMQMAQIEAEKQRMQFEAQQRVAEMELKKMEVESKIQLEQQRLQQEEEQFFMGLSEKQNQQDSATDSKQQGLSVDEVGSLFKNSILSIGELANKPQTINVRRGEDGSLTGTIE